jgi:hypothetical protein
VTAGGAGGGATVGTPPIFAGGLEGIELVGPENGIIKGQLISEGNFGVFKSPKKQTFF